MSSYFSSFSSTLSSRLTNLRRAITYGDEADDPDNEDCSHISNVLRAYYTEKGRPFPPWLPPDPKGPPPSPARVIATSQIPPQASYFSQTPADASGTPTVRRPAGLSDLWGDTPSPSSPGPGPTSPQPLAMPQTSSLRRGRAMPQQAHPQLSVSPGSSPGQTSPRGMSPGQPPVVIPAVGAAAASASPLPSQRAGSIQSGQAGVGAGVGAPPRKSFESAPSAQERLRARLQSGGRSSSANSMPQIQTQVQGHAGGGGGVKGPYMEARYNSSGYLDPAATATARKPVGSSSTSRLWGSR